MKTRIIVLGTILIAAIISLGVFSIRTNSNLSDVKAEKAKLEKSITAKDLNIKDLNSKLSTKENELKANKTKLADQKALTTSYADSLKQSEKRRRNQVWYYTKQIKGLNSELTTAKNQFTGLQTKYDEKVSYFEGLLAEKEKTVTMQKGVIETLKEEATDLKSQFPSNVEFATFANKKIFKRRIFKGLKENGYVLSNDAYVTFFNAMPKKSVKKVIKPFVTDEKKNLDPKEVAFELLED